MYSLQHTPLHILLRAVSFAPKGDNCLGVLPYRMRKEVARPTRADRRDEPLSPADGVITP